MGSASIGKWRALMTNIIISNAKKFSSSFRWHAYGQLSWSWLLCRIILFSWIIVSYFEATRIANKRSDKNTYIILVKRRVEKRPRCVLLNSSSSDYSLWRWWSQEWRCWSQEWRCWSQEWLRFLTSDGFSDIETAASVYCSKDCD